MDDEQLQRSIRDLADGFERGRVPEERVTQTLEARLRQRSIGALVSAAALGVIVLVAAVVGVRLLTAPSVGTPAAMPALVGLFVTQEADEAGRCYAVRLYDTTPTDGRVALWTWTGSQGCAARVDNISMGAGRADGVLLPSGRGILIRAADTAPAPLGQLELVLDPGEQINGGMLRAFQSVEAAATGSDGIVMNPLDEIDIPYRPG
jgi:hypothetical protein